MKTLIDELCLRDFSPKTIKAYTYWNQAFLGFIRKPALEVTVDDIKAYQLYLANKNIASASRHTATAALRFYYTIVLRRRFTYVYPKVRNKIPEVLSKEEVSALFSKVPNTKHRLMLHVMYAAGLRVGELIHLQWQDVDFNRNSMHLKMTKGRKDRIVMLSQKVKEGLLNMRCSRQGCIFLSHRNKKYSQRSIQKIIEHAASRVGIQKHITPHTLRHSFATHLLENGTDIRHIRDLLGHSDLTTTLIYTKVSDNMIRSIISPLDVLYENSSHHCI